MTLDSFLPRLRNVRRTGDDSATALCSAHADTASSLSIRIAEDGRILLKCFRGCTAAEIVDALGLELKDLFPANNGHGRRPVLTIEELAKAKGLPVEFLRSVGVEQARDGVKIAYLLEDRSPAPRQRRRTATSAKEGSSWYAGAGKLVPYGLDRLAAARTATSYLFLVEGESDCWAAWLHDLHALGVPGADLVKSIQAEYLTGISRLYVVQEPDAGGETFVRGIARRLAAIGWTGEAWIVTMPDGIKDILDLHRADPTKFVERLREAVATARRLELPDPEAAAPTQAKVTHEAPRRVGAERAAPSVPVAATALVVPEVGIVGLGKVFADLYARYLEVPRSFLYFGFLTYFGAVIARCITLDSELRPEPRLYTILLGESADTRKSTALLKVDHFFKSLARWVPPVLYGVGSAEGIAAELQGDEAEGHPVGGQRQGAVPVGGAPARIKGRRSNLILHFDELKAFVDKARNQYSVALPMVASLFERTDYDNRTKTERLSVRDAHLSLLAACTLDTYATIFDPQFFAIGFLNRLWVVSDRTTRRIAIPQMIPAAELDALRDAVLTRIETIIKAWIDNQGRPVAYRLTPGALAVYRAWYEAREGSIFERRLDTYGHRLLLLLAATTGRDVIDEDLAERVVALLRYQLAVRRETDPVDAENVIAATEEKIRRTLKSGAMSDRALKRKVHYDRIGLFAYNTALGNLKQAGEVAFDGSRKLYFLPPDQDVVSTAGTTGAEHTPPADRNGQTQREDRGHEPDEPDEVVTNFVTTTKCAASPGENSPFRESGGVNPPHSAFRERGGDGGDTGPETAQTVNGGRHFRDGEYGGDRSGDSVAGSASAELVPVVTPAHDSEACDCHECVPPGADEDWTA